MKSKYQYNGVIDLTQNSELQKYCAQKHICIFAIGPIPLKLPTKPLFPGGQLIIGKVAAVLQVHPSPEISRIKTFSVLFVWSNITTKHDLT